MHIRCPHCQNPIEVVDGNPLTDVSCPSCGSNFNLISGETDSYTPGVVRTIGHFELLESVGGGHFGTVWKARDTKLDRTVAVKIPRRGQIEGPEAEMFIREARAAAQVKHPGVVGVYEVGRDDGTLYIVSDFIAGCNLKEWLSGRRLAPREAAELCMKIAEALHVAHEAGVIHRDLKPGNVMMDMAGQPHLTDFGLAKREAGEITMTVDGQVLGTPAYMPPEQARGEAHTADRRSDVYSLGVILFELLTGELPFRGSQRMMIVQILQDEPPSPRKLQRSIPRDLETICLKCLEKSPAKRFQTAADLAAELKRFLRGEPIVARPIGKPARLGRWCKRNPAWAAAGLLAALMLIALIVVPILIAVREYDNTQRITKAHGETLEAQGKTVEALGIAKEGLRESRIQAATSTLERALLLCEQGEINHGLLWLTRGLETARLAEAHDLEQAFRWNLGAWSQEVHRLDKMLSHPGSVKAVAFSPDGTLLATGCTDGKLRLWDVASGRSRGEPFNHPGQVHCLAFHPQGHLLLSGCRDGMARLWDVASGRPIGLPLAHCRVTGPSREWPFETGILSVAFSPDGRTFITGGHDGTARLWDTATGAEVAPPLIPPMYPGNDKAVFAVAFRPDGKAVLTGASWALQQWDARTGKAIGSPLENCNLLCAAYSPNGKSVLAGYMLPDRAARQWNLAMGQKLDPPLVHRESVWTVCYSPDGRFVLTGSQDQTARLWDAATGYPIGAPMAHPGNVHASAFSPDGTTMATGCGDTSARLWKVAPNRALQTLLHPNPVSAVAFSPDGKWLLTGCCDNACRLWDVARGRQVGPTLRQGGWATGVAFSADGKTAFGISHQGPVQLYHWDLGSGRLLGSAGGQEGQPCRLAAGPDCATLVTGAFYSTSVRIWDGATLRPRGEPLRHKAEVRGVAVSPDGQVILTGSADKTTSMWNALTGLPIGPPVQHPTGITAVAFNSDGKQILTGSSDGVAQRWDAGTWKPLGVPLSHHGQINSVAFADKDTLLVTASDDNSARLWFARTSHPVGPGHMHTSRVTAVALSSDGRSLATASSDGTAKLWAMPAVVAEEPEQLVGWTQALTGQELDERNNFRVLPAAEWQVRRDRFAHLPSLDGYTDPSDVLAALLVKNADHPNVLAALLADADAKQFPLLLPALARLGDKGPAALQRVLARDCEAAAGLRAISSSWSQPPRESVREIESADGILTDRWAFCQTMPLEKFVSTAESLRAAGYRPAWFQHYVVNKTARIAAVWDRDGRAWKLLPAASPAEVLRLDKELRGQRLVPTCLSEIRRETVDQGGNSAKYLAAWASPSDDPRGWPGADVTIGLGPGTVKIAVPWTMRFYRWPNTGQSQSPADWEAVVKSKILHERKTLSLDFDWDQRGPDPAVPAEYFAVVATAEVEMEAGKYYLREVADDGIRVYVDDKRVLDEWRWMENEVGRADFTVTSGRHLLRVEYFQWGGPACLHVGIWPERLVVDPGNEKRGAPRTGLHYEAAPALPADNVKTFREMMLPLGYRPQSMSLESRPQAVQSAIALFCDAPAPTDESAEPRAATAAVALLRLGHAEQVWPLLRHSGDPSVRSHLIHCLGPLGADPRVILRRLDEERDVLVRRALILCLGEFGPDRLPADDRDALVPKFLTIYRDDPDAGVHGAAEWLLRQWKQQEKIRPIDQQLATGNAAGRYSAPASAVPGSATGGPREPANAGSTNQWYVNGQGHTMVILPGPVEFMMGSPQNENQREASETLHRQRIARSFAIASKEATVAQFEQFMPGFAHHDMSFRPEPDSPIPGVTWYEAAAYCNWLSKQEGIVEDQWCYQPNNSGAFAEGMKLAADWSKRTGYRLPSEAEWEYACRAGAVTSRYYGRTEELLGKYACYIDTSRGQRTLPAASLKPNDFGLFDMLGNEAQWCQDPYESYATDVGDVARRVFRPGEDRIAAETVRDNEDRVLRGSSFCEPAPLARCARRSSNPPTSRNINAGFRVARTCN